MTGESTKASLYVLVRISVTLATPFEFSYLSRLFAWERLIKKGGLISSSSCNQAKKVHWNWYNNY